MAFVAWAQACAAQVPPPPKHYFNDYAALVKPDTAARLDARLEAFERETSNQIVVAIFPNLPPDTDQFSFTTDVFRAWKPGQAGRDNGAILFVFVREHQLWIQTGSGLERALPDALCKRITADVMAPAFKAGRYEAGLEAGVEAMEAMEAATRGEFRGTGQTHAQAAALRHSASDDDPDPLSRQVLALYQQGKYQEALPFAKQLLAIRQRALGPEHPDTALSLNNLALLYQGMGNYAQAQPLYQQALQICQKALGSEHLATALILNNLAECYEALGEYEKAEPLLEQALQIRRKALGPDHPDTAASLNNLAGVYCHMGAYAQAEPLLEQAFQVRRKALEPAHPDFAQSLNGLTGEFAEKATEQLASLSDQMRQIAQALESQNRAAFDQALQVLQKALPSQHPDTAQSLNNLANLYIDVGAYEKAEPLLEQALQTCMGALGPEHPDTVPILNNLAMLHDARGDYPAAEAVYEGALKISRKALGLEHPTTATILDNLAGLYSHMGVYETCEMAEPLYQQALQIRQKALGPDHPATAASLNSLAMFHLDMGEYEKAEPLLEQALQIRQKALGPDHPATASSLDNLGFLKFYTGQADGAKALAQRGAQARLAILAKVLSFTSEQQRLSYQATLQPYSLFALLDHSDADLAATALRYKGVVLDSLIEDRLLAQASTDRELLGRLAADKHRLGQLLLQPSDKPSAETDQNVEALEHDVEQIEGQLARRVAGLGRARRALSVTVDQVQTALPPDGALIEYVRYAHDLGKGKGEGRYGAVVLAAKGPPRWLSLGSAEAIDAAVSHYQCLVRQVSNAGALADALKALYDRLWGPIQRALPAGVKRAIISPDGRLNFVSFATLLDAGGRFLAERYALQYVASGRDLLREGSALGERPEAVVFANPDFEWPPSASAAPVDGRGPIAAGGLRGAERRDLESLDFGPLPGTQQESDRLSQAFAVWHWSTKAFTGREATKAALRQVHAPYVLHLATHGFFEPDSQPDPQPTAAPPPASLGGGVTRSKFFKNPMHRSGLALAGAQRTLDAWKRGEVPPTEDDGVVTAEDVAALDLKGTWLVTLSACDTGSGEAQAGEGVLGLRRGFMQAGAQHLLLTLWPISDETTVQIMTDFYKAVRNSGRPAQALAEVQRAWLVKLREEGGLAQAVRLAGPFVMNSQGKP